MWIALTVCGVLGIFAVGFIFGFHVGQDMIRMQSAALAYDAWDKLTSEVLSHLRDEPAKEWPDEIDVR